MDRFQKALTQQCDALIRFQQNDKASDFFGGFYCPVCKIYHGRADNAVFPMAYAYKLTGNRKYTDCIQSILVFRKKLADTDGGVFNDFDSSWKGITVFSALGFYKTLAYCKDILPRTLTKELELLFAQSAEWVYNNLFIGAKAYINYYAAAAAADAAAGTYFGQEKYTIRARELLSCCMALFTENGLLCGEGQPHNGVTKNGCRPIDIGYNAEESLPALTDAAELLKDAETESLFALYAVKMLDFMLPDGAWDNSFGLRNNKWTYWGSRTSDGCPGAFMRLQKYRPELKTAALKNTELMLKCSKNGLIYGGRDYIKLGQPPCIHHTLTHGVSLADALANGLDSGAHSFSAPESSGFFYRFYPELNTCRIFAGKWLATVTAYGYYTGNYEKGASHASGGTVSLLYHNDCGPVLAGSTFEYKLTEPNNMQLPLGNIPHETLIMRAEYEKDGIKYATCLDFNAVFKAEKRPGCIFVAVTAHFADVKKHKPENEKLFAHFDYAFYENKVTVSCRICGETDEAVKFILPVIENSAKLKTEYDFSSRKIFFLSGGFIADEYSFFTAGKNELTAELFCSSAQQ